MKVLAIGASSKKQSINRMLANYAATMVAEADVDLLDLKDFAMPLYCEDLEALSGQPAQAQAFLDRITAADVIVISFAEHNGNYSAAFKNVFDWASRINHKMFTGKPMLVLSTSPGPGGAGSVLQIASTAMPHFGAEVKASVSVPSFYDNFDMEKGEVSNQEIAAQLKQAVEKLIAA